MSVFVCMCTNAGAIHIVHHTSTCLSVCVCVCVCVGVGSVMNDLIYIRIHICACVHVVCVYVSVHMKCVIETRGTSRPRGILRYSQIRKMEF